MRGFGIACAHKNVGFSFGYPESCTVGIELYGGAEIERAVIRHGASEVGMGAHTVITQMAADALSICGWSRFQLDLDRHRRGERCRRGLRLTHDLLYWQCHSRRRAESPWKCGGTKNARSSCTHTYYPPKTTTPDPDTGQCDPNVAYSYTAQAAEVTVDLETGLVEIERIVCAIDVGKAINPQQVIGQIEGGLIQSVGYAVMENFVEKDGKVLTPTLSTYLVPTAADVPPEIESIVWRPPTRAARGARAAWAKSMNMAWPPP